MRFRLLGRSGLRVSGLCLGTMTFDDDLAWGTSKEVSRQIYTTFLEAAGTSSIRTHTGLPRITSASS